MPPLRANNNYIQHLSRAAHAAGRPAHQVVPEVAENKLLRPHSIRGPEVDDAHRQVRPRGDNTSGQLPSPREEDTKAVAMLRARLRDLMGSDTELRQDVDELQRRDQELRVRAHSSWAEQRQRVEETRQEYRVAVA